MIQIKDASVLREGNLLKLHSHPTREFTHEEEEHGPSIQLHPARRDPAASAWSFRPFYIHGLIYWIVLRTWDRDWVHVTSGGAGSDGATGWAYILTNSFELIQS
jgi:hypothetical protein